MSEKIRVEVRPEVGQVDLEDLLAEAGKAEWSDDPGTGKAVLLRDERGNPAYEVHNPLPHAPPIGFQPTPPIEELIRDRVRAEFARLRDEDEIDSAEEVDDFDVPDELPLASVYEVVQMEDTAPRPPAAELSMEERARMHVDFMELAERERLNRKRAKEAHLARQREAVKAAEEDVALYGAPPAEPQS